MNNMKLAAVGDISTGIGINWRYESLNEKEQNSDVVMQSPENLVQEDVISVLHDPDILFGNIEGIITESFSELLQRERGVDYDIRSRVICPPETSDLLQKCDFDVVNLANNHILDYGEKFVEETKNHLEDKGIKYIGDPLKEEKPITIRVSDHDVSLVGYNLVEEGPTSDIDEIYDMAKTLAEMPGVSVVSLHWGHEHTLHPSPRQTQIARSIAEKGVDVILGHHSHTFQPVEIHNNNIIAYSLGNFIFHQWRPMNIESGILTINVMDRNNSSNRLTVDVTPTKNTGGRVYSTEIERIRNNVPTTVNHNMEQEEYDKMANEMYKKYKRDFFKEYLWNLHHFPIRDSLSRFQRWGGSYFL